jgi:hypothetical protein
VTGHPDPEREREQLAGLHAASPGWEVWRRGDGVYCAWHVGSQPPTVLRASTVAGLAEAIEAETEVNRRAAAEGGNGDAGQH